VIRLRKSCSACATRSSRFASSETWRKGLEKGARESQKETLKGATLELKILKDTIRKLKSGQMTLADVEDPSDDDEGEDDEDDELYSYDSSVEAVDDKPGEFCHK